MTVWWPPTVNTHACAHTLLPIWWIDGTANPYRRTRETSSGSGLSHPFSHPLTPSPPHTHTHAHRHTLPHYHTNAGPHNTHPQPQIHPILHIRNASINYTTTNWSQGTAINLFLLCCHMALNLEQALQALEGWKGQAASQEQSNDKIMGLVTRKNKYNDKDVYLYTKWLYD